MGAQETINSVVSDLNNIVRDLVDEGDRVYLGSTNDADELRLIAVMIDRVRTDHLAALRTPPADKGEEK